MFKLGEEEVGEELRKAERGRGPAFMFERRKNLRGHVSEGQFPSDTAAFPQTIASSVAQITNNERCYCRQFLYRTFPSRACSDLIPQSSD